MVRRLDIADLPAVTAVQRACYRAELIESDLSFKGKIEPFWTGWGFVPRRSLHYAPGVPATYMTRGADPD